MVLRFYNSLTKSVQDFTPLDAQSVRMYTCGPTVYNYPHIGNYRAYIFADMIRRALLMHGYDVMHVMNITDVDDKTIRDSQAQGKNLKEFTEFYTQAFFHDRDTLGLLPATIYTRASDHIREMVELIEVLLAKDFAYTTPDGSVFFRVESDTAYGKLVHIDRDALRENAGGRMARDEYDKDNPQDFALWKAYSADDGDVAWEPRELVATSTIVRGRPGWHIECSAMSMKYLGESFDIHTGGVDNMFPHHENEIAQSECATGHTFSQFFMHNEHLLVDGKKMSKSLGNSYLISELISKGYSPLAYKYFLMSAHYRSVSNFTWEALEACDTALTRLARFTRGSSEILGTVIPRYREAFLAALADDLATAEALAVLWSVVKDDTESVEDRQATVHYFDQFFGFDLGREEVFSTPLAVQDLLDARHNARLEKNWQLSDELRDIIAEHGFVVRDTDEGQVLEKK